MRVLHLTTHLNVGGISQYIYSLLKAMREHLDYSCVVSSGGVYEKRLHESGIDTFNIPIKTKNIISLNVVFSILPLISIVKKKKIQLIHAHTRVTQVLAWCVSAMTGIPFVSTWHGYYKNKWGRRILPAYGKRVIAISDPVKNDLMHTFNVAYDKIRLVYNSIDIDEFALRAEEHCDQSVKEQFGLHGQAPIIGTVARLVEDKGHACLVKAFKVISKDYPNARLLIVGEGKYERSLRDLIQQLELTEKVILVGAVENVARIINAMDVFVLVPSLREGFGLSVIEAMTLKKPVIVSNIGGLVSTVKHNERGLVIEADNVEGLTSSLRNLINDESKCQRLTETAYEYCRTHFEISNMARTMKAVYEESLQ